MIYVKRSQNDTSQKVIGAFLKRVKKSSLVARKRKTKHYSKPSSDLVKKRKALMRAEYETKRELLERIGKK